ncbi:MAG: hypothetical protein HYU52_15215, partial [Acidobacteria bacterium]|nr:hypothetical protein [Acidobacteriota bacterium]
GNTASFLIARRGEMRQIDVAFGEKPATQWRLETLPEPTDEQKLHLAALLGQ